MNHTCEFTVWASGDWGRFIPEPCGRPAHFKDDAGAWLCADHYDAVTTAAADIANAQANMSLDPLDIDDLADGFDQVLRDWNR